jgi:hypothetical protein
MLEDIMKRFGPFHFVLAACVAFWICILFAFGAFAQQPTGVSSFNAPFPTLGIPFGVKNSSGNMAGWPTDASGYPIVDCITGCAGLPSIFIQHSASSVTGQVLKASAGTLYSLTAVTNTSASVWISLVDTASIPTSGASITAHYCFPVGGNNAVAASFPAPDGPYTTGIVAVASTTGCVTYNPPGTANVTFYYQVQ